MTTPPPSSTQDPALPAPPAGGASNGASNGAAAGSAAAGTAGASARYDVLEREGEGTLWVCYRARDRATGLTCALKALKSTFARHPRFPALVLARLQREVSLRAPGQTLPSLAAVYEAGTEEGTPYFVTDWIPSSTLETLLERSARKPLNRSQILAIVRSLAQALELLHANGLAHGDLRPRQVRLMGDGTAKLTDSAHGTALHEAGIQLTDVLSDAAFYQAPERWDNRPPSAGADLYALGVVLYRLLAGRVPFEGTSPLAIAMRHRRDLPLKPSQFNASCPSDLERVAMRLLEKEPQARYVSVAHLMRDLSASSAATSTSTAASAAIDPDASLASGALAGATVAAPALAAASVAASTAPTAVATAPVAVPTAVPIAVVDDEDDAGVDAASIEEKQKRRKQRRREFWGMLGAFVWMLAVGGALGGMVYGAYRFWVADIPREVSVPDYRGKGQDEVERLLAKRGLKFRVGREVYDPKRPSGTVLSGEPGPFQKVRVGREIAGTVSRGPEPIRMYDFSELTLAQARAVVARDGLRLGLVMEQYHDTAPSGYICGQFPEPGEVFRRTDPINLVVSRGPQPSADTAPEALPPLPEPSVPPENIDSPQAAPESTGSEALVQRVVQVRVAIPADASAQEVRIVAKDADGERTVYKRTHQPGEVVQENVQVTRAQGSTAVVSIYVGGSLFRELRV